MSKSDKPKDTVASAANLMDTMRLAGIKSMSGFGTDVLETVADIGSEVLNFTAARIQRDVQTQHDLLHAKDLAEVQHIQMQFFQKAMDDYAAETAKLIEMQKALTPNMAGDVVVTD